MDCGFHPLLLRSALRDSITTGITWSYHYTIHPIQYDPYYSSLACVKDLAINGWQPKRWHGIFVAMEQVMKVTSTDMHIIFTTTPKHMVLRFEVNVPKLDVRTIWTPVFEWCVCLGVKLRTHTTQICVWKRLEYVLKIHNHYRLNSQHVCGDLGIWTLNEQKNPHITMNHIFIWVSKNTRHMTKGEFPCRPLTH